MQEETTCSSANKSMDSYRRDHKRLCVWNLKTLEKNLRRDGFNSAAFTVRQVLDFISPNWERAEHPENLKLEH